MVLVRGHGWWWQLEGQLEGGELLGTILGFEVGGGCRSQGKDGSRHLFCLVLLVAPRFKLDGEMGTKEVAWNKQNKIWMAVQRKESSRKVTFRMSMVQSLGRGRKGKWDREARVIIVIQPTRSPGTH